MSNLAIEILNLGKMYKLYKRPSDKVFDAFGMNFWKKNYYDEFWALKDLSLQVPKGQRVGLIGSNGAGKSTLLKTIIGNVYPTEGSVSVHGEIQALMELGTGFHPEFTGRENIRASLAYLGLSRTVILEKENQIVEFAELEEFIDQPVKTYSAGMYARLAFSTATAIEPEILIIDEVLGAGDAYFAGKCVERMRGLTERTNSTVLFVSHDMNSILQFCDRVIWIDRGRMRLDGAPIDVIKEYSATVRKREEYRLMARDLKATQKSISLINRHEDIYCPMLFRMIGSEGNPPKGRNKFFSFTLSTAGEEIAHIEVGGPMDNAPDHLNYIMFDREYMNWSMPSKNGIGHYREFSDFGGKYKHAPLELTVPRGLLEEPYSLSIKAEIEDAITIEWFSSGSYKQIGCMEPQGLWYYTFPVSFVSDAKSDGEGEVEEYNRADREDAGSAISGMKTAEFTHDYGNRKVTITNVQLLNRFYKATKIFEVEEPLYVEIEYESKAITDAIFVFCIYLPDGRCASQWVTDTREMPVGSMPIRGKFLFKTDKLLLGKGSYIASVGMFKSLPSIYGEGESYHVIDRSIHFEIVQPLVDSIDRGLCIQPFEGMFKNE